MKKKREGMAILCESRVAEAWGDGGGFVKAINLCFLPPIQSTLDPKTCPENGRIQSILAVTNLTEDLCEMVWDAQRDANSIIPNLRKSRALGRISGLCNSKRNWAIYYLDESDFPSSMVRQSS
ncbi:MAG: hypothetical protein RIE06_13830 [Roseibium album]|uniref:hypothetical protein n=1 Tax=Roseibium album TaxID=311410 RepID=UPI002A60F7D9|nr:hypothetical protein [Paracoccaceae bacterium]